MSNLQKRLEVSIGRATDPDKPPRVRLEHALRLRQLVDEVEALAWRDARAAGESWGRLSEVTGKTRSAAQQRAASLWRRHGLEPPDRAG